MAPMQAILGREGWRIWTHLCGHFLSIFEDFTTTGRHFLAFQLQQLNVLCFLHAPATHNFCFCCFPLLLVNMVSCSGLIWGYCFLPTTFSVLARPGFFAVCASLTRLFGLSAAHQPNSSLELLSSWNVFLQQHTLNTYRMVAGQSEQGQEVPPWCFSLSPRVALPNCKETFHFEVCFPAPRKQIVNLKYFVRFPQAEVWSRSSTLIW